MCAVTRKHSRIPTSKKRVVGGKNRRYSLENPRTGGCRNTPDQEKWQGGKRRSKKRGNRVLPKNCPPYGKDSARKSKQEFTNRPKRSKFSGASKKEGEMRWGIERICTTGRTGDSQLWTHREGKEEIGSPSPMAPWQLLISTKDGNRIGGKKFTRRYRGQKEAENSLKNGRVGAEGPR